MTDKEKEAARACAIKEWFKQTYGVELLDFLEEAKYTLKNGETSVHHYPFCDWVEVDNFIDGIVDAVKTKNGSK